jgi:hypothetical protein
MYQVEYFLALRVREAGCLCSLYCLGRCLLTNPKVRKALFVSPAGGPELSS